MVGEVCKEVGESEDATFSRELVAILTETTFKQSELLSSDLELFAKHAKRTTVSMEDVRLCSRRNSFLSKHITSQAQLLQAEREGGRASVVEGKGNSKPTKRKANKKSEHKPNLDSD